MKEHENDNYYTRRLHEEQTQLYMEIKQLKEVNAALRTQRDELLAALKTMNRAYVNLLQNGRDRITMLGGECDPVDVMDANDPNLRESRAAIAKCQ